MVNPIDRDSDIDSEEIEDIDPKKVFKAPVEDSDEEDLSHLSLAERKKYKE